MLCLCCVCYHRNSTGLRDCNAVLMLCVTITIALDRGIVMLCLCCVCYHSNSTGLRDLHAVCYHTIALERYNDVFTCVTITIYY